MSFNLTINFESFEELDNFVRDMNKFKIWKSKQDKKKEKQIHPDNEIDEQKFNFTDDMRGRHQQNYHNQAKIYQSEHPELSYREALKFVYKNSKKIEITI